MYEDLVFPNIDIMPGELYNKFGIVRLGRSVRYEWRSDDFQAFAHSLMPLVVRHPIAQYAGITRKRYQHLLNFSRTEHALWSYSKGPERARKGIVVSAILEDIRTALIDAHAEGIPATSDLLNKVPSKLISSPSAAESLQTQDLLIKLYFDAAIYSPKPATLREALDIRENPRIHKWRLLKKQWQNELPSGRLTLEQAAQAIAGRRTLIYRAPSLRIT